MITSGCAPLRKKFTRQKKADKENNNQFIPVLDPIDYPEQRVSAEETYKYHYSLWKVWNKDLLQTVERDGSDKRQKYLANQSLEQLEAMHELLNDESKTQFAPLVSDLKNVLVELDKPEAMRSKFGVRTKIERYAKKVRAQFTPSVIFTEE